jgi:hypothetical protein
MQSKVTTFGTKWKTVSLVSVMLVSACGATGPSNACAGWKPITLATQSIDGLTDQDAQEILAHNLFGRERGCW